jgi:hypothetical protein
MPIRPLAGADMARSCERNPSRQNFWFFNVGFSTRVFQCGKIFGFSF